MRWEETSFASGDLAEFLNEQIVECGVKNTDDFAGFGISRRYTIPYFDEKRWKEVGV